MRHRNNKLLLLRGSVQGRDLLMRTMFTNLVKYGHLTTTDKKAQVLIAYTNRFFAKLVSMASNLDATDGPREMIRWTKAVIYGNDEGKKVITDLVPHFISAKLTTNFLNHYKLGKRLGDAAEQVRIELL